MESSAPSRTVDLSRPLVAVGVAFLTTTVALSAMYARDRPDLDGTTFAVGVVATAALLGIAVAALMSGARRGDPAALRDLVSWPGAFGLAALGMMILVGLDGSVGTYVGGAVVLLLSVGFVRLTGLAPFAASAVLGLAAVAGQLAPDVIGFGDDEPPATWPAAVTIVAFVAIATAAGWRHPTRTTSALTAGVVAVGGFAALGWTLAVVGSVRASFVTTSSDGFDEGAYPIADDSWPSVSADVWVMILLALGLIVAWTGLAAVTGHVGFRVLVIAMSVVVTPMATVALTVEHPTWWGAVLAVAGGGALLLAMLRRPTATPVSGGPTSGAEPVTSP
jgi:hypothetical protein